MIYRIGRDEESPQIDLSIDLSFDIDYHSPEAGNYPFFLASAIHSYADIWTTPKLKFIVDRLDNFTDRFPDLDTVGGKLFLSEKAYGTLKEKLTNHGEFLPVTFNAGKGYIFNPLENIAPIDGSVLLGDDNFPDAYAFDESNIPPIFKTEIDSSRVFITKDVYRMIRLNGLNGLLFYKDYSDTYAEPEGGYKGSTSMPGYENED